MNRSLLLIIVLIAACSSKPPKEATSARVGETKAVSLEGKQLASENESNLVTEVTFRKGKASISKTARRELRQLSEKAKKKGSIDEIKVVTWADREYPSDEREKLTDKEKDLVEKRNEALEAYLLKMSPKVKVQKISMAERPSKFQEVFATESAEVKESLESAGIPETGKNSRLETPRKASKSIVIFIMEEK